VPSAPTIGTATAGDASATVTWTAPASTGGSPLTGYVVTPFISGVAQPAVTFTTTATSQVITGLTNGTTYTFKVAATNVVGTGPQSAMSNAVTPSTTPPSTTYVSITPCRVVDTRVAGGALAAGAERSWVVTGSAGYASQGGNAASCGIPVGALAVEASVSAITPATEGFTRIWPAGTAQPNATFLNFVAGQHITNTGTIPMATTGAKQLTLHNYAGTTHYVIDIEGYWTAP
jgi:hypothetical protein